MLGYIVSMALAITTFAVVIIMVVVTHGDFFGLAWMRVVGYDINSLFYYVSFVMMRWTLVSEAV